jgi:hypothetical protein
MGFILCTLVTMPIQVVIQYLIPILTQIITVVCSWVSSVITVIQQVVNWVCSWLPWPFNLFCRWVTSFITVLQTVWNWICTNVVSWITTFITVFVTVIYYIVQIICVVINIVLSWPQYLACLVNLNVRKRVRVCIKVITDAAGNTQVTPHAIQNSIRVMQEAYNKCNIEVEITGITYISNPSVITGTSCTFWGLFSWWHAWFAANTCLCCGQITVFFVDSMVGVSGCAYWGENWCRVDSTANTDPSIMAHEVGHLLNLGHSSDPNNIMYESSSATARDFTTRQCCLMRMSSYTSYI